MNPRHAAALALMVWYLMAPPIESCNGVFSGGSCNQTPLAEWRIVKTYDALSRCENVKAIWVEKGQMYLVEMDASSRSRTTRMAPDEASATTETEATCVISNDPRLKAN
jgi:hypothetical protein